jgi:hypothetical protein
MSNKAIGIGMIEMYSKMIKDEFQPVISQLTARRTVEKANMEIAVRKEMGIYQMTIKKFKLQAQLEELKRQLKGYEEKQNLKIDGKFIYQSKIDHLVDAKMAEKKNGLLLEAETVKNDLIKRIKLAGVHGDVKAVFDDLSKLFEPIKKELKALPAVKPMKSLIAK